MKDDKKEQGVIANSLVLVLQLGLSMIVPVLLCIFVSYYISKAIDNRNVIIIGILLGIVAGINGVYRQVKRYMKDEESPGQRARRLEEESKNDNKVD